MKKVILYINCLLLAAISLSSCELFGLDLQEPYDYDSEKGKYDNRISMDAWEFVQSRTDIFSDLIAAVDYAGIDVSLYKNAGRTYLLPTNTALTSTTESDRSFFNENAYLAVPGDSTTLTVPTTWEEIPKQVVKDMLMYHILKYSLSYNELTDMTKGINHFFPTENESRYMAVEMQKEGALIIYFNNFDTHYKAKVKPRTSNLLSPNGSYIHVMDSYLQYPDEFALNNIPYYNKESK